MEYLFGGFGPLWRILIVGSLSYVALLVTLRLSGQRALGRMKTFDLVVAVAIGSTFGRLLTAQEVQFTEAVVAFAVLMGLHTVSSWLSYRQSGLTTWMENKPVLIYFKDAYVEDNLARNQLTRAEVRASVRQHGFGSMDEVEAVVLEADGSFSVLKSRGTGAESTLDGVEGYRGEGA